LRTMLCSRSSCSPSSGSKFEGLRSDDGNLVSGRMPKPRIWAKSKHRGTNQNDKLIVDGSRLFTSGTSAVKKMMQCYQKEQTRPLTLRREFSKQGYGLISPFGTLGARLSSKKAVQSLSIEPVHCVPRSVL
jgi:hypothetical protein